MKTFLLILLGSALAALLVLLATLAGNAWALATFWTLLVGVNGCCAWWVIKSKKQRFLGGPLVILLALGLTSCSARGVGILTDRVSIETNIPYHGTVLTVINQSDAPFNASIDGNPVASIDRGGQLPLYFRDFSGGYGQHNVQVVGPKGAAYRSVSVSGYSQSSETWIVTNSDLRR